MGAFKDIPYAAVINMIPAMEVNCRRIRDTLLRPSPENVDIALEAAEEIEQLLGVIIPAIKGIRSEDGRRGPEGSASSA